MRRFEFEEGTSSKFWEIEREGTSVTTAWGRIGTAGQSKKKAFDTEANAKAEYDKLVKEKTSKGYVETGTPAASAKSAAPTLTQPPAQKPGKQEPPPKEVPVPPSVTIQETPPEQPLPRDAQSQQSEMQTLPDEPYIAWTETIRERAHPRRGTKIAAPRIDTLAAFKAMTAYFPKVASSWKDSPSLNGPEWGAALKNVFLRLEQTPSRTSEVPRPATPGEEAVLFMVLLHRADWSTSPPDKHVLDYWLGTAGPLLAVESLVRVLEISVSMNQLAPEFVRGQPLTNYQFSRFDNGQIAVWSRLRRYLSALGPEQWEQARDLAARLREGATLPVRVSLAYLFPGVDEWALGDANAILGQGGNLPPYAGVLLTSLRDAGTMLKLVSRNTTAWGLIPRGEGWQPDTGAFVASILEGLGLSAVPVLSKLFDLAGSADEKRDCAEGLSAIISGEAFHAIAERLEQKEMLTAASDAFPKNPLVALKVLATAKLSGQAAATAGSFLTMLARQNPALAFDLIPTLPETARRVLESARAKTGLSVEEALEDELPRVLASPPWKLGKKTRTSAAILELSPLPFQESVVWKEGQRAQWLAHRVWADDDMKEGSSIKKILEHSYVRITTEEARLPEEEIRNLITERARETRYFNLVPLLYLPEPLALAFWETLPALWSSWDPVDRFLAKFELRALTGLLQFASRNTVSAAPFLHPFRSPRAVPAILAALQTKSARGEARRWLLLHAECAVIGLIPVATGKPGKTRDTAGDALRFLSANGHRETIQEVARRYGQNALDAVEEVLSFDPLNLFPAKIPALPSFWQPQGFTRPILKGTKRSLPLPAIDNLGTMLTFSTIDQPYAGIEMVRQACDPASLAGFAWDVFSAWLMAGAPSREAWAFHALAPFGDDGCARKLTAMIRVWPGESQHQRAVTGLDVLAAIGSDVALMHLNGIAQKVKFKGLQEKAKEKIELIAERRGLSSEELADRLVPDLGLLPDGSMLLDFGSRSFRVGFDENLRPYVCDAAGKRLPDLPKPSKSDDAEKSAAAGEGWKVLKKDVKALASHQILRMELAMCSGRRWKADVFRLFFVEHPLVQHLARRAVWGVFTGDGALVATFRVAEDGSFAGLTDDEFLLDETATVGIVHALELPEPETLKWGQILGDYEILQPFKQLGRDVYRITPEEAGAKELKRFEGVKVATGKVLGLEQRGWRRGTPQDGGCSWWYEKPLPGGALAAFLSIEPGIIAGMVAEYPEQTLHGVTLQHPGSYSERPEEPFSSISPIAFSEIVRDLEALRA